MKREGEVEVNGEAPIKPLAGFFSSVVLSWLVGRNLYGGRLRFIA